MKRRTTILAALLSVALAATATGSATLFRIAADQQKTGERATTAYFGSGGSLVYSKNFYNPGQRTYVTFSGQGDTHEGAALMIQCLFDGLPCEAGFGADPDFGAGWSTLNKEPGGTLFDGLPGNNCEDGGGGFADCHDNTVAKVWCIHNEAGAHTVKLNLGTDTAGAAVWYEKATILIDGSGWDPHIRCQDAGVLPEVPSLPGDFK